MSFRRRRLLAGLVAVLVFAAVLPASAAAGTYTQILCADPETGLGVIPDSQLPDGLVNYSHFSRMSTSSTLSRCSSGGGMPLLIAVDTRTPSAGAALVYRAGADVRFKSAVVYRRYTDNSNWSLFVHRAERWEDPYASPFDDRCDFWRQCTSLGAGDGFLAANKLTITAGAEPTNGFSFAVLCEIPDPSWPCAADESRGLRIFGGRVVLEDTSNPQVAGLPSGSLVEDTILQGTEELTVNATDVGSGLYRVRVLLDDEPLLEQPIDANGGRCVDAAPANTDPFEFIHRQPCKLSAGGTYRFDTTELPDGRANLKIQVEDASGNTTTLRNTSVTVDNIPAPSVVSAPVVSGGTRRGSALAVAPASWEDHGAASSLALSRVWQRCRRDGSLCADIPGASGLTYELGSDDLNRRLRVVETAVNGEGSTPAASALTGVVVREDGTLPPDNDGEDNDGDGTVDEPGEPGGPGTGTGSGTGGPATPSGSGTAYRPGSTSSTSSSVTSTVNNRSEIAGGPNGEGASPRAVLSVRYSTGSSSRRIAYGKSSVAVGRVVDENGRPIRDAIVDVTQTPAVRGARAASIQPAVTGADGSFRYTVSGRGPSRSVVFSYRYLRGGAVASSAALKLTVRAGVSLNVTLAGSVVRYRGRVLASSMPSAGKLVVVQGRSAGARWQTFASRRARGKGAFSGRYRLKVRRPGRSLQFRVRVLGESGWPYTATTSKVVTRRVK